MTKIFLAVDQEILLDGMKTIIMEQLPGIQMVGEACTDMQLQEEISNDVDALIIDMKYPIPTLMDRIVQLKSRFKNLKIIIISSPEYESLAPDLFEKGISGMLLKNCEKDELKFAISRISKNKLFISSEIAHRLLVNQLFPASLKHQTIANLQLSKRELQVLQLIAEGLTNNEIADRIFTSRRTVETHRKNLIEKTSSKNTASLIRFALCNGLISGKIVQEDKSLSEVTA